MEGKMDTIESLRDELTQAQIKDNKLRDTIRLRDQRIADLEKINNTDKERVDSLIKTVENLSKDRYS